MLGLLRASLAQRFHFFGGAMGVSMRWFSTLALTRNHRLRKSSTFFVTLVTALPLTQEMGMYYLLLASAMRKETHPATSLDAVFRSA